MRLDRHFTTGPKPTSSANGAAPIPLHAFAFGPMAALQSGSWSEIYRLAYERTVEALKPTKYDRAMQAVAN